MRRTGIVVLAVFLAWWIGSGFRPEQVDAPYDLRTFGSLPVLDQGRIKPLDSLARGNLLLLRGKQSTPADTEDGEKITALAWLWNVLYGAEEAGRAPVFRIDDPDLVSLLGYSPEEKVYFSYGELQPHFAEIDRQARRAEPEPARQTRFEKAVLKLRFNLVRRQMLASGLRPPESAEPLAPQLEHYYSLVEAGDGGEELRALLNRYAALARADGLRVIPAGEGEPWLNLWEALVHDARHPVHREFVLLLARTGDAAAAGDAEAFNAGVRELKEATPGGPRLAFEYFLNGFQPFYRSMVLYIVTFLLVCVYWARMRPAWQSAAFWTLVAAFLVHSFGLVGRMYIQGRPPVTNLYSSAVFIGWAAVLLSIFLERIHRNGMSGGVAAAVGFGTLVIAHHLSLGGDTMEQMRAVLDSNFWLTTHVITITLGYSAAFLAGFLALACLLRGLFTRGVDEAVARGTERMVFGVVCFALLFSFIGTVLGGIWADQSWGRFWGWDPKENGALLIVIWNAMILHGYSCRFFRRRGLLVLAISGNIVTSWSWFGTNMLGIGLHAYGFMEKGFPWLMGFWASQMLVMALPFLLPARLWRSPAAVENAPQGVRPLGRTA